MATFETFRDAKKGLHSRSLLTRFGPTFGLAVGALLLFMLVALFALPKDNGAGSGSGPRRGGFARVWDSFARGLGTGARFLVLTSSSCEDIQPKPWLTPVQAYDVVIFDYSVNHTCKGKLPNVPGRTLIHRPKTFKFPAMYAFFTSQEGLRALATYDSFVLADDDVDFHGDTRGMERLFLICEAAGMHICQPSLSEISAHNWDITVHASHEAGGEVTERASPKAYIRLTGLVEQMVPWFSREALMQFLPYFSGVTHAWGIDALWSDVSARLGRKVGIVDSVVIDHMRKSGISGLYKRVGGIEKARQEQLEFKRRYGLREEFFELMEEGHRGEGSVLVSTNFPVPAVSQEGGGSR